ncbi:MAG TPA: hypothetical protein VLG50_06115 [Candidatus Saccharimonadales bacterium]|nr:hypothetical protein [Candidatus Saccharimonadales bacterium]
MKNILLTLFFIYSIMLIHPIQASQQGSPEDASTSVDVAAVPVYYYRPAVEGGQQDFRPSTPAQGSDAEYAQAALQEAIESGDVEINPGDEVTLTIDRQTGEVFVTVETYDAQGNIIGAMSDRIGS